MDAARLDEFKKQLLQLQAALKSQEEESDEDTRPVELDQARVGRLSRMDAMQAQAMAQETGRRRKRHLEGVAGALRRIESDDFGDCFSCGEEIDVRRLAADPTNTRCIRCADN